MVLHILVYEEIRKQSIKRVKKFKYKVDSTSIKEIIYENLYFRLKMAYMRQI